MATIIKIDPPKALQAKHRECGATIQYELREVKEVDYRDYDGCGGDTYYEATCPNCGNLHQWIKK